MPPAIARATTQCTTDLPRKICKLDLVQIDVASTQLVKVREWRLCFTLAVHQVDCRAEEAHRKLRSLSVPQAMETSTGRAALQAGPAQPAGPVSHCW